MEFETKTLLSGILKYGKTAYADCADILDTDCFPNMYDQLIFMAYGKMFEKNEGFSLASLLSYCTSMGVFENSFNEIKSRVGGECDNLNAIRPFAHKIKKVKIIDDCIASHKACIDKLKMVNDDQSVSNIFSISEKAIFDLIDKHADNNDNINLGEYAQELIAELVENPVDSIGLPLPWPSVNESIGKGLRTGVTLIGARPKTGKTSFGVMTMIHTAHTLGIPVLFLDTEMTKKVIVPRVLANMSEVSINEIETGQFGSNEVYRNSIDLCANNLVKTPICYRSIAGKPFDDVLSIIRRWIYTEVGLQPNGLANQCLIIYDYFKLTSISDLDNANESQAMGFQISRLTDFCNKYEVPCLSFVQLNRAGIDKESTDVIFGSDKLLHLCNSFSIFKAKTPEEMAADGFHKGNRKLRTIESRYGGQHEYNEYVSMSANLEKCCLYEVELTRKYEQSSGGKQSFVQADNDVEI